MTNINRTISLDPLTDKLSRRVGNFSSWIRCKLLEEHSGDLEHIIERDGRNWLGSGKCNPVSLKGCCPICWPKGIPNAQERELLYEEMVEARLMGEEE